MTLHIPKIMYGRYRDVKPRLMRIVKHMLKGSDWLSMVEQGGFLDVASTPGLVVGDGPSPLLGREEHFQMWFIWPQAWIKTPDDDSEIAKKIFRDSLTRPWSLLGLTMYRNHDWFVKKERFLPFLSAVCEYWHEFAAIGARYTLGSRTAHELWNTPTTVGYVTANLGVSAEEFRQEPSAGSLARLLREHGIDISPREQTLATG